MIWFFSHNQLKRNYKDEKGDTSTSNVKRDLHLFYFFQFVFLFDWKINWFEYNYTLGSIA